MITKITLDKVASFKSPVTLSTDKRINLIYGLNGTGKSTFSKYLYKIERDDCKHCKCEKDSNDEILVYNKDFVEENFLQENGEIGAIFTMSKNNTVAEKEIQELEKEKIELETALSNQKIDLESINKAKMSDLTQVQNKTWEIKDKYSGKDRSLDFCVHIKDAKLKLFDYLKSLPLFEETRTIVELEEEAKQLKGANEPLSQLPLLLFKGASLESNTIFQDVIVGNENSTIGALIKELNNGDWVKKGVEYLQLSDDKCPFCQQSINTADLTQKIESFFDKTYEAKKTEVNYILNQYRFAKDELPLKDVFLSNQYLLDVKNEFEAQYKLLEKSISENIDKMQNKLSGMSSIITLSKTDDIINNINNLIRKANEKIMAFNEKIKDKKKAENEIKTEFWKIMRKEYNVDIVSYETLITDKNKTQKVIDEKKASIETKLLEINSKITQKRGEIQNIDEAIHNINARLLSLGIAGFSIVKSEKENFYKLARDTESALENTFSTLSEGEKMLITFLYFCELCNGQSSQQTSSPKNKIVVIDDPISSLSHIHVFNVSCMIRDLFFKIEKFNQIFILTHSLYFFGRLLEFKKDKKNRYKLEADVKLFRFIKNISVSAINDMKQNDVQNEYQAYWEIVKNKNDHFPLMANCMRNILEYFFGFVERLDINNLLENNVFQETKYQGFRIYINAESHSNPHITSDSKEFNYDIFIEALYLVFNKRGYEKHFEEMYGKAETSVIKEKLPKE